MNQSVKILWLCAFWCLLLLFNSKVSAQYIVSDISIEGNHKTKDHIILREFTFSINDTVNDDLIPKLIEETKDNILLTGLFNIVNITHAINGNEISFKTELQERWYLWIYPIFEFADRNFDTYFYNQQWSRINYGLSFEKHNFRGRNETLHFKFRLGYKEQYSFYYYIPYLDINKNHGIWIGADFFRQKEVAYNILDYRYEYLKSDKYIFQYGTAQLGYQYRLGKNTWIKSKLAYHQLKISDTVYSSNPQFLSNTKDYKTFALAVKLQFDKTDNQVYPTKGLKSSIIIEQKGILPQSPEHILNIKANLQYHNEYYNRNYFSIESEINYFDAGQGNIPFSFYDPLGFDQYLRGFDNLVFNADLYAFLKASLKYEIIPYRETNLPIIPLNQFNKFHFRSFIVAFLDTGYISNYGTALGAGIGLDFVFYYDRVLSTYIAWNNYNKKIGIFVQYKTPLIKQF